jgi:hypothetical protein
MRQNKGKRFSISQANQDQNGEILVQSHERVENKANYTKIVADIEAKLQVLSVNSFEEMNSDLTLKELISVTQS